MYKGLLVPQKAGMPWAGVPARDFGKSATNAYHPYSRTDWALDFVNGIYWDGKHSYRDITKMPGYSYSRSGATKYELSATGMPVAFSSGVPSIIPGVGYQVRSSTTNIQPYSNTVSAYGVTGATSTSGQPDELGLGGDVALITSDNASGTPHFSNSSPVTFSPSTTYTISRLVKPVGTLSRIQLTSTSNAFGTAAVYANYNLEGSGAVVAQGAGAIRAGIETLANGWYRVWLIATSNSSVTPGAGTILAFISSDTATRTPVGAVSGSFLTTHAQVTQGSHLTPIIITGASSTTIGYDNMAFSGPIPTDEDFVILVTANLHSSVAANALRLLVITDGTLDNRLALARFAGRNPGIIARVAGVDQVYGSVGGTYITSGRAVFLLRRSGGKYSIATKDYADTTVVATLPGTAGAFPLGMNTIEIGHQLGGSVPIQSPIERIVYKKGTFSDADVASLLTDAGNFWNPAMLGSKLILWWDAEDLSTLTFAGSAVSAWTDKSAGFQVTQGTSGQRPVRDATALNGRPGVVGDGTNDTLGKSEIPSKVPAGQPRELWALAKLNAATSGTIFRQGMYISENRQRLSLYVNTASRVTAVIGHGNNTESGLSYNPSTVELGIPFVVRHELTLSNQSLTINGGTKHTGPFSLGPPAVSNQLLQIGSDYSGGGFFPGATNTIIQTEPLTDAEAAQMTAWLKFRGGIA